MAQREEDSTDGNTGDTDVRRRLPVGPMWSPKVDIYTHPHRHACTPTHTFFFFEREQRRNRKIHTEILTLALSSW